MATNIEHHMSKRGWATVEDIMPKIKGAVAEREKKDNPNIDLSTAENWLLRSELIGICKDAVVKDLTARCFSYPRGFSGDPDLLDAYSKFFNTYFKPHKPVQPSHLATAPGAMACIDTLLYNICDPGDGVLIPGPYWNGFDFGVRVRSSVTPVLVNLPSFDSNFNDDIIAALEEAYTSATCPIKALMITNPHNPLAVCYPKEILEKCLLFCKKYNIHFISDEVYALSVFENPEMPDPLPFVSVLSLDLEAIGADASRVHMVWSTSKDFGQSGFRMGVSVTQANQAIAVGLALAANTQISALSTIFVTALLMSPQLPSLIKFNSERLATAYKAMTDFLKEHGVPYYSCNAGLYVFAKISPQAQSWEDESAMVSKLKDAGVLVSSGRAYHGPEDEKGWARLLFALGTSDLQEAIQRMGKVFSVADSSSDT